MNNVAVQGLEACWAKVAPEVKEQYGDKYVGVRLCLGAGCLWLDGLTSVAGMRSHHLLCVHTHRHTHRLIYPRYFEGCREFVRVHTEEMVFDAVNVTRVRGICLYGSI